MAQNLERIDERLDMLTDRIQSLERDQAALFERLTEMWKLFDRMDSKISGLASLTVRMTGTLERVNDRLIALESTTTNPPDRP